MDRVLKPGGSLLIANLTSFTSACAAQGWVKDEEGQRLHFPVDRPLPKALVKKLIRVRLAEVDRRTR